MIGECGPVGWKNSRLAGGGGSDVGRVVVEDHDVHAVGDRRLRGVLGGRDLERIDVVVDEQRALEEQVVLGDHQDLLLLARGQQRVRDVVERERIGAAGAVDRPQRARAAGCRRRRQLLVDLADALAGREIDRRARVDRRSRRCSSVSVRCAGSVPKFWISMNTSYDALFAM